MNRREFLTYCAAVVAAETVAKSIHPVAAGIIEAEDLGPALDDNVAPLMERYGVPGISVAILKEGTIAHHVWYGVANAQTRVPIDGQTVFEAASLTKPLLAQAVLDLWEDAGFDLNRPLVEYHRPERESVNPDWFNAITATHVLSHTTGLPNWQENTAPLRMRFEPGTQFSYSGIAFVLLQRVVESLTDMPFERYINERLFTPLSMESASLVWREDYESRLAYGHTTNAQPSRQQMHEANAASSLICSAKDYARVIQLLLNPDTPCPLQLRPDTLDLLLQPRSMVTEGVAWGLGWGIQRTNADDTYWHWGNNGNRYNSFVVWNRKQRNGAIVMTNSGNGLKLCKDLIPTLVGGEHPAFNWKMVVR